jgi:hypothetical protein
MKQFTRFAALVGISALLPACGQFGGFFVPFPNTIASVNLRGSQVVPAVVSAAAGTATITVDGLQKFVTYKWTLPGSDRSAPSRSGWAIPA